MRRVSLFILIFALMYFAFPAIGYCSVESTLTAVQSRLVSEILPLVGILAVGFAGLSFLAGSPNARSRLMLAIVGAVVAFGATSIIDFIRSLVQ